MPESKSGPFLFRFRSWVVAAFCAYWLALFIATHIPLKGEVLGGNDKLLHTIAYAMLIFLAGLAMASRPTGHRAAVFGMIPIFAVYGLADELLQIPVGRNFEFMDWVADILGLIIGATLCWAFLKFLPNVNKDEPQKPKGG